MPSQATQAPDSSFSFSKPREVQGLTPLTVKQIGKAQSSRSERGNFIIDGVDVNNVKVVGMVLNRVERTTDVGLSQMHLMSCVMLLSSDLSSYHELWESGC
ncbi:hypothetical protein Droror1_Dr00013414 [Drosera rotundifolia]